MIAKLPILGFTLVTALAGQAVAHENCDDGQRHDGQRPTTYRAPPPVQPDYSRPAGYQRGAGHDAYRPNANPVATNELRQSDLNRDGWITLDEALRQGRRDFHRTDRDQNRVLSRREVSGQALAYADRDHNGRISYDEYQTGIRHSFARFDANRDGVLASYELNGYSARRPAMWR